MNRSKSQFGMSLVWVLVITSTLTLSLIHYSYVKEISSNRHAFQFTISQIHSILNLATSYRLQNGSGEWPISNAGDCLMPDAYIDGFSTVSNGWGYEIDGVENCDDLGDIYAIEQMVPSNMSTFFERTLNESVTVSFNGMPNGMVRLIVQIDLASVDEKKIFTGKLSNSVLFPLAFDSLQCSAGENENYVVSLDSYCGKAPDKIINIELDPPDSIFSGFGVLVRDQGNSQELTYRAYIPNEDWYRVNNEWPNDDGHMYADEDCPANNNQSRYQIDSVLFAWCE